MTLVILLYLDMLLLSYFHVLHIKWFLWLFPLWYTLANAITKGILVFADSFPILSLPIMILWSYFVIRCVFGIL